MPRLDEFGQFVCALAAQGGEALAAEQVDDGAAVFRQKGVRLFVIRYQSAEATAEILKKCARAAAELPVDIVLVGGGEQGRTVLKGSRPLFSNHRVGLFHVDENLGQWSKRPNLPDLLEGAADKMRTIGAGPEDWQRLLEQTAESRAEFARQAAEMAAFVETVRKRRPVATLSLAVLIGIVFVAELLLGGYDVPVVLVGLGALVPGKVHDGQWWRLVACTFVHASWPHVLFNTYVLVVLGSFLEKIIGSARLLLLYTLSALAGSAGSLLALDARFSVGASGAVWGLLVAHAVIAYRHTHLLPKAMLQGARRAAKINLVINIINSFQPHVDMWAHFAGGAGGGLLMLSGALTRSLPRLELGGHAGDAAGEAPEIPVSVPLRTAGVIAFVFLVAAGPVAGIINVLSIYPGERLELVEVDLPEIGVTAAVPRGLKKSTQKNADGKTVVMFGDPLEPIAVSFAVTEVPPVGENDLQLLKKTLVGSLRSQLPKGAKLVAGPREFAAGKHGAVAATARFESGAIYERAFLFMEGKMVRVEVVRWPGLSPRAGGSLAVEIAKRVNSEELDD